jgi:hypothetical protein
MRERSEELRTCRMGDRKVVELQDGVVGTLIWNAGAIGD